MRALVFASVLGFTLSKASADTCTENTDVIDCGENAHCEDTYEDDSQFPRYRCYCNDGSGRFSQSVLNTENLGAHTTNQPTCTDPSKIRCDDANGDDTSDDPFQCFDPYGIDGLTGYEGCSNLEAGGVECDCPLPKFYNNTKERNTPCAKYQDIPCEGGSIKEVSISSYHQGTVCETFLETFTLLGQPTGQFSVVSWVYADGSADRALIGRNEGSDGTTCPAGIVNLSSYNITVLNDYIFFDCDQITGMVFPTTLEQIGKYAFWGCTSLTTVDLSGTQTEVIVAGAFEGTPLTSFTPSAAMRSIGEGAFKDTQLTALDLSGTQTELIGTRAFKDTPLGSFTPSASLKIIGAEAFWSTGLQVVDLSGTDVISNGGSAAFEITTMTSFTSRPHGEGESLIYTDAVYAWLQLQMPETSTYVHVGNCGALETAYRSHCGCESS